MNMYSLEETMESTNEASAIIHGLNIHLGPSRHFGL